MLGVPCLQKRDDQSIWENHGVGRHLRARRRVLTVAFRVGSR